MKRAITKHDERLKNPPASIPKEKPKGEDTRQATQAPTNLFFAANTSLGPPYHVLVDTNFVSHTIRAKLDLLPAMMDLCVSLLLRQRKVADMCVMLGYMRSVFRASQTARLQNLKSLVLSTGWHCEWPRILAGRDFSVTTPVHMQTTV